MVKEYKAIVEKTYRIFIIASICLILYMSLAVSDEVQTIYPNIDVGFWGPVVAIILILFVVWLMDKFFEFEEVLTAVFYDDYVVLKRGKRERTIPYHKIKK